MVNVWSNSFKELFAIRLKASCEEKIIFTLSDSKIIQKAPKGNFKIWDYEIEKAFNTRKRFGELLCRA